jgi:hypothetical protein
VVIDFLRWPQGPVLTRIFPMRGKWHLWSSTLTDCPGITRCIEESLPGQVLVIVIA